jgi:hypothetical protein
MEEAIAVMTCWTIEVISAIITGMAARFLIEGSSE